MLFHLEMIVRESLGPAEALAVRKDFMEQIDAIMKSGKVKYSGIYADERGGFFIIEIDSPEELKRFTLPINDVSKITTHPIVPLEVIAQLFQKGTK